MITNPAISIIVPVYNASKYIKQCLDSLINQTLRNIEIICINDGSKDDSLDLLKQYETSDNRITVINQDNSGVSVARNNGLKHIRGEYYMFVDSDDWLDIETCAVAYNYAKNNSADCLMFSYVKEFGTHSIVNHIFDEKTIVWTKSDVLNKFHRRLFGPIGDELSRPQDMDIIVSPCMQLFRTDKFSSIHFTDIREIGSFEDGLYQIMVYKDCDSFVYIDEPFYHYRKTNECSVTTMYKPNFTNQFLHLFDIMDYYITYYNFENSYTVALQNRIALSTLGLGLNDIKAPNSLMHSILTGGVFVKHYESAG